MRSLYFIMLLIVSFGVISICVVEAESGGGGEIELLLEEAKKASGDEYCGYRDKLVELVKSKRKEIETIRDKCNDWQTRLLCSIIIERHDRSDDIQKLLEWKPKPVKQPVLWRIEHNGKKLAEVSKSMPYFLMENLWKTNELSLASSRGEQNCYIAVALGANRVKESRELLESFLVLNKSIFMDYEAARKKFIVCDIRDIYMMDVVVNALGELGCPESFKPLLDFIIKSAEHKLSGNVIREAIYQLKNYAREEELQLLKEILSKAERGEIKDTCWDIRRYFKKIIPELEEELKKKKGK